MSAIDAFYEAYTWYAIVMRVFEDSCRRLMDAPADHDERKALVDESLESAMEVSDAVADAEDTLPDAMEEAGGDQALVRLLTLAADILKEDGARAASYANAVTSLRMGRSARKVRSPRPIANPFAGLGESQEAPGEEEDAADEQEGGGPMPPEGGSEGGDDEDSGGDSQPDEDDPGDGSEGDRDDEEEEQWEEEPDEPPEPAPRRPVRIPVDYSDGRDENPEPRPRRMARAPAGYGAEAPEEPSPRRPPIVPVGYLDGDEEPPEEPSPRQRSPLIAEAESILGESPEPPSPGRRPQSAKRTMRGMRR